MNFRMLLDTDYLCGDLSKIQLEEVLDVLYHTDSFNFQYEICEEYTQLIYELLYKHRHDFNYRELSRWWDRNSKLITYLGCDEFNALGVERESLVERETNQPVEILQRKEGAFFVFDKNVLYLSSGNGIREVTCEKDFVEVMTVLGENIGRLEEFVVFIKKLFRNLLFDDEIEQSIEKMEAGFARRKHEILEHLMILNLRLPEIMESGNTLSNKDIGKKLAPLKCSPERNRDIVNKKLTKIFDEGKRVNCELHTKLKQINSNAPDRIYFCAKVPKDVRWHGENISDMVFVFKISCHV